jgi:plastocyanin
MCVFISQKFSVFPTSHSITIQDLGIDALVPAQQNASVILRTAGDYDYFCGFHPTMKGEISVTP